MQTSHGLGIKERSNYKSELTVGGGRKTGSLVERGFAGYLDEVTILGGALSADRVRKDAQSATALWATLHGPGASQTVHQDPINQAMNQEHSVNQILIRFKSTISPSDATNLIASYGTARVESYRIAPIHLIQITDGMTVSQKLAQVRNDSRVLYAEPNYVVSIDRTPNDPGYPQLWGMHNSSGGGDISAPEAWSRAIGSRDVIVAVIDTGIDYNHVDLKENMWVNIGEIPTNGVDDDGNGFVDDVYGYDFFNENGDPADDHGHGTHVAGTIGAVGNNRVGVVGVNWRVRLMALKFLGAGGFGFYSDAIRAIQYAWMNGAKISNNSWGGYGFSQGLYDAIAAARNANHLFCASAGNDANDNDGVFPAYPASFDLDNIISVGASDHSDAMTYFSNYGKNSVDLFAPGSGIYSTGLNNTYETHDGTSMAAPHVAGTAALMLSINPDISYAVLKQMILDGADQRTNFTDYCVSGGRLNSATVVGGGGIALTYFSFDDWGLTAEDFTIVGDWSNNWSHAGMFFNATSPQTPSSISRSILIRMGCRTGGKSPWA